MPMKFTYIGNNGILAKGIGSVTRDEISEVNRHIYESPQKIQAIKFQICDFTEVNEFDLSAQDIKVLAAQDVSAAKINPKMIIAVVGEKDLIFGLSRMWEVYADESTGLETCVFRSINDANVWIEAKMG